LAFEQPDAAAEGTQSHTLNKNVFACNSVKNSDVNVNRRNNSANN
jgi:hypothetical protein